MITENKQKEETISYFEEIIGSKLPKEIKLISRTNSFGLLKPMATVVIDNNAWIKALLQKWKCFDVVENIAESKKDDYDIVLCIKKGTNLFSFTKSREGNKQWWQLLCIPKNDQANWDKEMKTLEKQNIPELTRLLK